MTIDKKKMVDIMRQNGYYPNIERYKYPIQTKDMLDSVEMVGKIITPKFVIDEDNRWAYTQLAKWLFYDPTMEAMLPSDDSIIHARMDAGIYLAGGTGTGKTIALRILRAMARYFDIKIKISGEERCLFWTEHNASDISIRFSKDGDLSEYETQQILCIQDFGAESKEVAYMGNKANPIRNIIESRADAGGNLTLFSSNLPMRDSVISKLYGDRVCSRLIPMCNYIVMRGRDRRRIYG